MKKNMFQRIEVVTMNNEYEKRMNWADNLKVLGIFLVVFGHCYTINNGIRQYVYSFHVPLFFFLSGLFFNSGKYTNFKSLVVKKSKSILVPYFLFSAITYLCWIIVFRRIEGNLIMVNPMQPLLGILYSNAIGNWMIYDGPLWFLTCLFLVELEYYFINKYKKMNLLLILILFSIIGFIDSKYMMFRFPWSLDVSFTAIVFYGLGNLFKLNSKKIIYLFLNKKNSLIVCLIFLTFSITFSILNGPIDMNLNILGNIIYFYISSLSGIAFYLILFICFLDCKFKLIEFIAKNTIIIMALHGMILNLTKGILFFEFKIPKYLLSQNPFVSFTVSVICIFILIPIIKFINMYMPFLIGRKN